VHAFRAAVPFNDFETQAFPTPVSGVEPAHQAAPTPAPPPPSAVGDANTPTVDRLAQQYKCFREGLGCYTGQPMSIFPDPAVRPIHLKARPVPFAIEAGVGAELDRMVAAGILEPTNKSAWAMPIVVAKKAGAGIRICGDYKSTVNKAVLPETYHMPTIDEAFAKSAPAHTLSKIDLVKAYKQTPICDMTSKLCTIKTHQGLYKFKRLPFGINVAAIRFERLVSCRCSQISMQNHLNMSDVG